MDGCLAAGGELGTVMSDWLIQQVDDISNHGAALAGEPYMQFPGLNTSKSVSIQVKTEAFILMAVILTFSTMFRGDCRNPLIVERPKPELAPIKISIPYIGKPSHQISRLLKQQAAIDTTFSASPSLSNILSANERKPAAIEDNNPKCVIYQINCVCGQSYIGETSRPINTRVKEHQTSVTNSDSKSAISDHIKASPIQQIQWTDITILENNQTDFTKRKLTEAIHIRRQKPSINRDQGYFIPSVYDALLHQAQSIV